MRQPIFGAGQTSKSFQPTASKRVNMYAHLQPMEDAARVIFYGTPGLTAFAYLGETPVRGAIEVGSVAYVVHRDKFYEVNNVGQATERGTIDTTQNRVDMGFNDTQVWLVDGINLYVYTIATTTLAKVTTNVISNPKTTSWLDGYTVVENGTEFQVSSLDDATTWDAADVASAESFPDDIRRVFATKSQLVLLGQKSTEFWSNVGTLDFPFQRIKGTTSDWGIAARWSVARLEGTVAGLFQNESGEGASVRVIAGYQPVPISTPDEEQVIADLRVKSDATGLAYRHSGHSFYQLNFPTEGLTMLYDFTSGTWSYLESGESRHRAEIFFALNEKNYVTDYEDGNIYLLDPSAYTENGSTFVSEIVSNHLINRQNDKQFSISSVWLDLEPGNSNNPLSKTLDAGTAQAVGSNTLTLRATAPASLPLGAFITFNSEVRTITAYNGTTKVATLNEAWTGSPSVGAYTVWQDDPAEVMLYVSKDRGRNWLARQPASMGNTGEYNTRARWNRFGRGYSFTFKARISDPIKRAIIGEGWVDGG